MGRCDAPIYRHRRPDFITGVKSIPAVTRVWRDHMNKERKRKRTEIQVPVRGGRKRFTAKRSLTAEEFSYARGRAKSAQDHTTGPLMMTLAGRPNFRVRLSDPLTALLDDAVHHPTGSTGNRDAGCESSS